jgi:hypothetical protein
LLLTREGETNWIRGTGAALDDLINEDGSLVVSGYDKSRSVIKAISSGGKGFAECGIFKSDADEQLTANLECGKASEAQLDALESLKRSLNRRDNFSFVLSGTTPKGL